MAARNKHKDIGRIFQEGIEVDEALARGVLDALRRHKQMGAPAVGWEKGRIVLVPPERINLRALEKRAARRSRTKSP